MKICVISPQIPSPAYGRRGFSFLSQMVAQGHAVTLHCLNDPGPVESAHDDLVALGIEVRPVGLSRIQRWSQCLFGWFGQTPLRILHCQSHQLQHQFLSDLVIGKYDYLHVDRFRMAPYALQARSFFHKPIVIDYPDALSLYYERAVQNPRHLLKARLDRREQRVIPRYEKFLLKQEVIHLVCSEVDRSWLLAQVDLQQDGVPRIEVIPHLVDCEDFHPKERTRTQGTASLQTQSAVRGVFTGTLYYLPNIDGLLWFYEQVMPLLEKERFEVEVIGFGATQELAPVKSDPRFHFTGYVANMSDYLFTEDLYLCPIRIAAGVRNKLLEAFAAGMATVSTTMGYEGIECIPGVHLLVGDTPEEFAQAIRFLISHPEEKKRLGENARRFVLEKYSGQAFATNLSRFYPAGRV